MSAYSVCTIIHFSAANSEVDPTPSELLGQPHPTPRNQTSHRCVSKMGRRSSSAFVRQSDYQNLVGNRCSYMPATSNGNRFELILPVEYGINASPFTSRLASCCVKLPPLN